MPQQDHHEDKQAVARGAGLAFLGRLGALIEVVSVPVFAFLYGGATFGIFTTLWGYVKVTTSLSEWAMATSLQRFVPSTEDEAHAHGAVRIALIVSTALSLLFAGLLSLAAPVLAPYLNAAEADAVHLVEIIRVYAWALPFWTFVEVATAAVRARGTFGPEIRVRIFYEQGLRLIAGVGFYFLGVMSFGLFYAHLVALAIAAALSLRLVGRHYELRRIFSVSAPAGLRHEMMRFATPMTPANIVKKLHSELPVMILNFMLPGAAGAIAAGAYGVARKIVSVLAVVRLSFEYVMAPLASAKHRDEDRAALAEMYAFATRMTISLAFPIAATLIAVRHDLMAFVPAEYSIAAAAILVLAIGRGIETIGGPASALVEMKGHRMLPLLNAALGIGALVGLSLWLIPVRGIEGAAIAAAVGLNATSFASLLQVSILFRLSPFPV